MNIRLGVLELFHADKLVGAFLQLFVANEQRKKKASCVKRNRVDSN
jgi:hypothetical protein